MHENDTTLKKETCPVNKQVLPELDLNQKNNSKKSFVNNFNTPNERYPQTITQFSKKFNLTQITETTLK